MPPIPEPRIAASTSGSRGWEQWLAAHNSDFLNVSRLREDSEISPDDVRIARERRHNRACMAAADASKVALHDGIDLDAVHPQSLHNATERSRIAR